MNNHEKVTDSRKHIMKMLYVTLTFKEANHDPVWVKGMIISWVSRLAYSSYTTNDTNLNKSEIHNALHNLILECLACSKVRRRYPDLIVRCHKVGIIKTLSISDVGD